MEREKKNPRQKSPQDIVAELSARYSAMNLVHTGNNLDQPKLPSGVQALDSFLEGGLPFGHVTEFGMPLGKEGRLILLKFVIAATTGELIKPMWTLWVSSFEEFQVFPPAWYAKGVNPARIVFASTQAPARDLKRLLLNPLFKVTVFDSPKIFTKDDCNFLNRQARLNHRVSIVLRDYFLSNKLGNIWAKTRINCWRRRQPDQFVIRVIRGLSYRELTLREHQLEWP